MPLPAEPDGVRGVVGRWSLRVAAVARARELGQVGGHGPPDATLAHEPVFSAEGGAGARNHPSKTVTTPPKP